VCGEVARKDFGQRKSAAFGGGIVRAGRRAAVLSRERGDVHDAPRALRREVLAEHLAAEQNAAKVDAYCVVELLGGDFHYRYDFGRARVVHEHVDRTPAVEDGIARGLEVPLFRHIELYGEGA
jgi:hypothetical protein